MIPTAETAVRKADAAISIGDPERAQIKIGVATVYALAAIAQEIKELRLQLDEQAAKAV